MQSRPCKKIRLPQGGVGPAKRDHPLHKAHQLAVSLGKRPIEPVPVFILAISVVVAVLGASAFVAHIEHRDPLADKEKSNGVFLLPQPECIDLCVFRRALNAAVPAVVVIGAVVVVFAVVQVVLLVVGK